MVQKEGGGMAVQMDREECGREIRAHDAAVFLNARAFSKAFYERYGAEVLAMIADLMGEYAAATVKMAESTLKGTGMRAVGELLGMYEMFDIFRTMEITELSDDVMHMKSSPCPFGLEGTSRELCEAIDGRMWEVVVSTLSGQGAEVNVLKSVAAGDEYCEVVCTIKT